MANKGIVIAEYPIQDVLDLYKKYKMDVYSARDILQSRIEIPFSYDEKPQKTHPSIWANSFVTPSTVIYGPEEMILSLDKMFIPDTKKIREELSEKIENNWKDEFKNVAGSVHDFWFHQNHFSLSKNEFEHLYSIAKKLQDTNSGNTKIVKFKEIGFNVYGEFKYNLGHPISLFLFGSADKEKEYLEICKNNGKCSDISFHKDKLGKFIGGSFITLQGIGNKGHDNPNIYLSTQGSLTNSYTSLNDRAHFIVRE